jgi:CheY-like chemotaxis protein
VGIAAEDLERIFQPFERIESAHHPARYGTGLGLTITKLLTEAMGGQVTVKSTPGQGSCFRVRLMLSAVTPRGEQSAPLRAVRGYEGPRKTILVVDDDPIHVMLMRDVLTPLGFSPLVAMDGRECLSLAASEDPDAVLLDISLPGMDGWEVSQRLREDVGYIAPIVMISANAWEDKYRNAAADFYNAYLIKPIQIASLLETLSTLMGLHWIYDVPNAPAKRVSLDDLNAATLPSPEELGELIELASIGHMRGILEALDGIAANRPGAEPLLAHLRGLAERVELAEFSRVLKDLSGHAP